LGELERKPKDVRAGQVLPILDLGQLQLEVRRRSFAGVTIPPVGEHNADIQKRAGDCCRLLRSLFVRRSDHRCHRIRASSSGIATPSQRGITRAV
jgi:hypothetical protein